MKTAFKKSLALVLAAVMLLCALPFTASAETNSGTCGDNLTWSLDTETGVLNITGTGAMTNYSNYAPWYSYRSYIKTVNIASGVTTIGYAAFFGCDSLTSVTIPDSVTTIGEGAFYECYSLTRVTIPDSVTSIGYRAFYYCDSLTSVTIGNSVTTIGVGAFRGCDSLTDVYYTGTEAQWKKIAIGSSNNPLKNATIHFNSTGDNPTPDNPTPDNPNELTLVSTYPANGATQLAYDDDLVLTFSMNVERNLSTLNEDGICIGIYDYKTDELVKSFDGLYVGYKHSGKTMTFEDAFRKLEPGKKYYIKIADDAIYSKASDKTLIYKGINSKDQWSFSYLNPTQKQGYSLDIYSSDRAITVSKGETQQVNVVLSLNGKPCKQDGISLSVANNGVAEISKIERESDRTVVTLKGLKNGTTTVTVTDNGSKTVQTFPVFVTDEASVYYFTDVEKYTEYNPMILDDMFIDSFKHKKNNNGSYTVTFDVYNMGHSYGAVDVYDKNGNVVDSQIIELFDSDYPTDLFNHFEYAGKLVGNFALDIITGDLLYSVNNIKSDLNSKQTSVSVTVPENGYYVITKNVTASNSCLLYNAFTLALDLAFESVGLIVDATDVAEELAQGVLSKNVDKYLKKICETFIEKGALLSAKNASVMAENLIIDVEYLFEAMGTTFVDAVIEAVPKVTTKITKEQAAKVFFGMSLKQCGKEIVDNILYGSIKAAKWLTICQNIYDYRNSNGAYVYASQNGNTKTSNGVIAKSDSDAQTIFHSILVTSGYYADYIDAMHRPEADAELYSISMIKNGQKVQPSSPVTIYIPIPDGWGSEKIYIYHIKDNFEREELEGTIENGYIKFVTNGFSYFVIANDVVNFIDEFSIKPYSIATVNYGDTLVLQADLGEATLPEGWSIQWTVDGSGFNVTAEDNGMKCRFTSVANGNATIKATLVNESGEAILDAEDNEMSNEISLNSNASFWQKIVSFFKNLFRVNRIIY